MKNQCLFDRRYSSASPPRRIIEGKRRGSTKRIEEFFEKIIEGVFKLLGTSRKSYSPEVVIHGRLRCCPSSMKSNVLLFVRTLGCNHANEDVSAQWRQGQELRQMKSV